MSAFSGTIKLVFKFILGNWYWILAILALLILIGWVAYRLHKDINVLDRNGLDLRSRGGRLFVLKIYLQAGLIFIFHYLLLGVGKKLKVKLSDLKDKAEAEMREKENAI